MATVSDIVRGLRKPGLFFCLQVEKIWKLNPNPVGRLERAGVCHSDNPFSRSVLHHAEMSGSLFALVVLGQLGQKNTTARIRFKRGIAVHKK